MRLIGLIVLAIASMGVHVCAAQSPSSTPQIDAQHGVVRTPVRMNPAKLQQFRLNYPTLSKLFHEQGKCIVKITVKADGSIEDAQVAVSSGFTRLDEACLHALQSGDLLPATQDGVPVTTTAEIPIDWKLPAKPKK